MAKPEKSISVVGNLSFNLAFRERMLFLFLLPRPSLISPCVRVDAYWSRFQVLISRIAGKVGTGAHMDRWGID
jgi:hypothetical protein